MALSVQIQPVIIFSETGTTLECEILYYDLQGTSGEINWWLLDVNGSRIWNERWQLPQEILSIWGEDDMVIIQGLADHKGFTILT